MEAGDGRGASRAALLILRAAGFACFFRSRVRPRWRWTIANVLGYVAFRKALLQGGVPEFTCLVGTMVQETYETTPAIRRCL
jgi:hypothetical protein